MTFLSEETFDERDIILLTPKQEFDWSNAFQSEIIQTQDKYKTFEFLFLFEYVTQIDPDEIIDLKFERLILTQRGWA